MVLTNNQKKFLRSMAHNLNPVVMIGSNGLSEAVLDELKSSIKKHELLKIKIRVEKEERQKIITTILAFLNAELVQVIGNILVIYCTFEEAPKIILPRK